jgi:hypothetical protein
MFPVDCVSHGAATLAKKHCKLLGKRFVALPRSGLGTFGRAIEEFAGRSRPHDSRPGKSTPGESTATGGSFRSHEI